MKKLIYLLLLLISTKTFSQNIDIDIKNERVWDGAGVLLQKKAISNKILEYEKTYNTGVQILVATTPSLQGYEPYEYAVALGKKVGVGARGSNNGIVVLIAPNERKWFIATGYGMEYILTDSDCKTIGESSIDKNEFKSGIYDPSIFRILEKLHQKIGTMSKADREAWFLQNQKQKQLDEQKTKEAIGDFFFWFFVILTIFGFIFFIGKILLKISLKVQEYNDYLSTFKRDLITNVRSEVKSYKNNYKVEDFTREIDGFLGSKTEINFSLKVDKKTIELKGEYARLKNKFNELSFIHNAYETFEKIIQESKLVKFSYEEKLYNEVTDFLTNLKKMEFVQIQDFDINSKETKRRVESFQDSFNKIKLLKKNISRLNDGLAHLEEYKKLPKISADLDYINENKYKNISKCISVLENSLSVVSHWKIIKDINFKQNINQASFEYIEKNNFYKKEFELLKESRKELFGFINDYEKIEKTEENYDFVISQFESISKKLKEYNLQENHLYLNCENYKTKKSNFDYIKKVSDENINKIKKEGETKLYKKLEEEFSDLKELNFSLDNYDLISSFKDKVVTTLKQIMNEKEEQERKEKKRKEEEKRRNNKRNSSYSNYSSSWSSFDSGSSSWSSSDSSSSFGGGDFGGGGGGGDW